ncbi:MAG: insulinase family protein [Deltaproteobacteria bacterium]|nr:insulinase family protein [Deltaproteobacteria bacterium]
MANRLLPMVVVLLLWPWSAQADDVPKVVHERYALPSGMEVLLVPDRSVPLVAVNLWVHVGSGDEVPGRSGFAHLFEHMMFQGGKHAGEDQHFPVLRKVGATGINGTTNSDRTNYFEQVPSHHLETALWLESDRLGWLLDLLNQKSLDNQREVVRNERRQRYDNVPYGKERFEINRLLYDEGHPYRHLTIGLHQDLERASLDDVRGFFRFWYVPSNTTLCLAGDFDPKAVRKIVAKWFGSFPRMPKPAHADRPLPVVPGARSAVVVDPLAKLVRLHWAWHSPKTYAPGDAELDIAAHALGSAGTGRLYKRLVHQLQLAQSVSVHQASAQLSSTFHVTVDLRPGADREQAAAIVQEELARLANEPIDERERNRAVVEVESAFVWGLEGLNTRCEVLQGYNHYLGQTDWIAKDLQRYRGATPQAVRDTAARFLRPEAQVFVLTMPGPPPSVPVAPPKGGK